MKKMVEVFISRGFIITLSVAVQIAFWWLVFTVFQNQRAFLTSAMMLVSVACVLHILIKDISPEHKIAWIIFMVTFPIAGGTFYLFFGKHKIRPKTQQLQEEIEKNIVASCERYHTKSPASNARAARQQNYLKTIAHAPAFAKTSVRYLPLGEDLLREMVAALKQAEKFIFIEFFIIEEGKMWGEIEKVLVEKAKAGVDVRVLYDDMGCLLTLPNGFAERLRAQGIDCRVFNKVTHLVNANFNHRDHRKICIVDGNVGFNGGVNLADEYINHKVIYGHWKDTAVMLQGEGVYGLTMIFLSMWGLQTGKAEDCAQYAPTKCAASDGIVQPFGDSPLDDEPVGESIYMSILNTAKDYVYITSPYLIISREMIVSLTNAAKAGVDVRLILPGIPDKKFVHFLSRSYYPVLLKAGVKIYEYTPGFIHAKMFVSDDDTAIVGTINLDYRSLDLHFECGTMLFGNSAISDIKADFCATLAKSTEITEDVLRANNRFDVFRFVGLAILKTFSPLM